MRNIAIARCRYARALICLCTLVVSSPFGQQGHPLTGSWSGEWTTADGETQRILLALDYGLSGAVSGAVFFGTRRLDLARATLDPASWSVRFEALENDSSGRRIEYVIEGRIENLGSTTARSIVGNLSRNGERGMFKVVMN
jgi:hypothetical protein